MRNVFNTHLGSFLCLCRPPHMSQSVKLGQARRRCVQRFTRSQVRTATWGPAEHFHPCTCHLPAVTRLRGLSESPPWGDSRAAGLAVSALLTWACVLEGSVSPRRECVQAPSPVGPHSHVRGFPGAPDTAGPPVPSRLYASAHPQPVCSSRRLIHCRDPTSPCGTGPWEASHKRPQMNE